MRGQNVRLNSNLQSNDIELDISEALQAGGVAVIATSTLTPRCSSRGGDHTGLGRWAWTRLEGSDNIHTRMVSVYRPCEPSGRPGPGTVFEQHRRFFGENDLEPRQALLDDLREAIISWQEEGDIIVLGMDANEDTRSRHLCQYFSELNMKNAILDMHKDLSPPATHARNKQREPIDGIWVSKSIDPIASGFLALGTACPSDHMALWVDFRKADLLGEKTSPIVFKINKLKADDPRLVNKYNSQSKKELATHKAKERLITLLQVPKHKWNDDYLEEFNTIHGINVDVRKRVAENLRKVCLGNLPWSPQFQRFYDRIELMKLVVNKRKGVRASMTKIRRLAKVTGEWQALTVDLQGAKQLLNEAFKAYKQARKQAPAWRETHLDALDRAKAEKNNSTQKKE